MDVLVGYVKIGPISCPPGVPFTVDPPDRHYGVVLKWYEADIQRTFLDIPFGRSRVRRFEPGVPQTYSRLFGFIGRNWRAVYVQKYDDVFRGVQYQPDGTETDLVKETR